MANDHVIRTARLTDRQVIGLIFTLKDNLDLTHAQIVFGGNVVLDVASMGRDDEEIAHFAEDRHAIRSSYMLTSHRVQIHFFRGISENSNEPHSRRQSSPYFDEVLLASEGNNQDPKMAYNIVQCIDIIESELPKIFPISDAKRTQDIVDLIQAEIASFSDQYRKMTNDIHEERISFVKEMNEHRVKLEQEIENQRKQMQDDMNYERGKFERHCIMEKSKLKEKEKDLNQREQTLDDRKHMHARRELRQQIAENFRRKTGQPVVSRRASRMRWTVFALTVLSGLRVGYLGISEFQDLLDTREKNALPVWLSVSWIVRAIVPLFLSIGFIAYAINWLRLVYLDDVRTERRYENYGNDIDRASFVIETIMEVGEKEEMQVPNAWIEGVCRNLFTDKDDEGYGKVPSNAAAMLLESIAGARIGPEGTEITVDRRGARRLSKQLSNDKRE